jgi:hypothetical protein
LSDLNEDFLARVVLMIQEDPQLRQTFLMALQTGSATQQVRVGQLRQNIIEMQAPKEVLRFVDLLGYEQIAHQVLRHLQTDLS